MTGPYYPPAPQGPVPPQGPAPPQGPYAAPPAYSQATGPVTQPGYGPPPGYGAPPGYGPAPGPPGYGPGYGPGPAPQKGGMSGCLVAFLVVLAVVVIGGIVTAILFATVFTASVDQGLKGLDESMTVEDPSGGIGDTVRDGQFEFLVRSFECGLASADIEDSTAVFVPTTGPTEQFCGAEMRITNIGDEPRTFTGVEQRLYESKDGELYVGFPNLYGAASEDFDGQIRPGETVDVEVVWAVPKNVTPKLLDLHDSIVSGGVTVDVG